MYLKQFVIIFLFSIITISSCHRTQDSVYYEASYLENYVLVPVDTIVIEYTEYFSIGSPIFFQGWNSYLLISDRDNACIWILDAEFQFITKIGTKGQGPGEFTDAPIPLLLENYFWLIDYNTKRAYKFNTEFNLISSALLPDELYILPSSPIAMGDYYILSAGGYYPQSEPTYYDKYNPLFVLDTVFNVIDNILEWDEIYYEEKYNAYAYSNFITSLARGNKTNFFARQMASYTIHEIDDNVKRLRIFGREPKYYHPPKAGEEFDKIQRSTDSFINFMDGTTLFSTIDYDASINRLYAPYYNITRDAMVKRNPFLSSRYLQVFDDKYRLIYDEEIPGIFTFSSNGNIYIRHKETPGYMKLITYQLLEQ